MPTKNIKKLKLIQMENVLKRICVSICDPLLLQDFLQMVKGVNF